MIVETKYFEDKIVPCSNLWVGTVKRKRKIAIYNVRSLVYKKIKNVKLEMKQLKIDILDMSEIKWTEQGDYRVMTNAKSQE